MIFILDDFYIEFRFIDSIPCTHTHTVTRKQNIVIPNNLFFTKRKKIEKFQNFKKKFKKKFEKNYNFFNFFAKVFSYFFSERSFHFKSVGTGLNRQLQILWTGHPIQYNRIAT